MSVSLRDLRLLASCSGFLRARAWRLHDQSVLISSLVDARRRQRRRSAPEIPASIRPEEIVGRWGYGAYHKEEDRARTEAAARGQCGQPVVINRGPNGGVMMYLADSAQLQELHLKGSPSGKNYVGPPGPVGGTQDREIVAFDGRSIDPALDGPGDCRPLRHRRLCALRAGGRGALRQAAGRPLAFTERRRRTSSRCRSARRGRGRCRGAAHA